MGVTSVAVDTSVVAGWFRPHQSSAALDQLRAAVERGAALAFAPPLLWLELLNIAGRRWRFSGPELLATIADLDNLVSGLVHPDDAALVPWIERGLTSYEAVHVVAASEAGIPLVTRDEQLLDLAPSHTITAETFVAMLDPPPDQPT